MNWHSSGLFFAWLRWACQNRPQCSTTAPAAILSRPPCRIEKTLALGAQFILLEALSQKEIDKTGNLC
jgi:hypothetical protein